LDVGVNDLPVGRTLARALASVRTSRRKFPEIGALVFRRIGRFRLGGAAFRSFALPTHFDDAPDPKSTIPLSDHQFKTIQKKLGYIILFFSSFSIGLSIPFFRSINKAPYHQYNIEEKNKTTINITKIQAAYLSMALMMGKFSFLSLVTIPTQCMF
jgi:hypothetical protein